MPDTKRYQTSTMTKMHNTRASLETMPDEILLQILNYALILPRGIHFNRWHALKELRLHPVRCIKVLSRISPEAFYGTNVVTIGPSNFGSRRMEERRSGAPDRLYIQYPPTAVNHWVRRLEIALKVEDFSYRYPPSRNECQTTWQISWLKRLAAGHCGFLQLVRLSLRFDMWPNSKDDGDFWDAMAKWPGKLRENGVDATPGSMIIFRAPTVEIVVVGHRCTSEPCSTASEDSKACLYVRVLGRFFGTRH